MPAVLVCGVEVQLCASLCLAGSVLVQRCATSCSSNVLV